MPSPEPKAGERVKDGHFEISGDLVDVRIMTAPLAWFPRLLHAAVDQRADSRIPVYVSAQESSHTFQVDKQGYLN